jgi:hypothetical protein
MALQCAIKLGIPNAIHRCGGTVSLTELHAALPVAASKRPCVSRIMTFLAASGIFVAEDCPADAEVTAGVRYSLTPASRRPPRRRRRQQRQQSPSSMSFTVPAPVLLATQFQGVSEPG